MKKSGVYCFSSIHLNQILRGNTEDSHLILPGKLTPGDVQNVNNKSLLSYIERFYLHQCNACTWSSNYQKTGNITDLLDCMSMYGTLFQSNDEMSKKIYTVIASLQRHSFRCHHFISLEVHVKLWPTGYNSQKFLLIWGLSWEVGVHIFY